jgi:hypothetical protein
MAMDDVCDLKTGVSNRPNCPQLQSLAVFSAARCELAGRVTKDSIALTSAYVEGCAVARVNKSINVVGKLGGDAFRELSLGSYGES